MTRRRHAGPGRAFEPRMLAKKQATLPEGTVRCGGCGVPVKLTPNGHLRGHKMPNGDVCPHKESHGPRVKLDTLPPIVLPPDPPERPRRGRVRAEPAEPRVSRLDGGSRCTGCGCWLPGERSLCGLCAATRGR